MSIPFMSSWHSLIGKSRHIVYIPTPIRCNSDKCTRIQFRYRQIDLLPDIRLPTALHTASTAKESSNAKNNQEDTVSDATNSEGHTASLQDTDRPESQSPPVQDNTDYSVHQDIEQSRAEHLSDYRPKLEDIPESEDDKENWEGGQFADADFIDRHNTTEESDRIHHEYSAHFETVTDQGYSPHNSRTPGLEYQNPRTRIL